MGNRNKAPRTTHPLLVAAAALNRATDPANPSRLTVLRLLGDALHALQDSHITVTAIKSRAAAHQANTLSVPLSRAQIEADNRFRHAHDEGARVLFAATVSTLLKLPARAGPLRRRAVDLLNLSAMSTGLSAPLAAADRIRAHLSSLKRLSWAASDPDPSDFDVAASALTLADVSACHIASRDVARESALFLLATRIRQKCPHPDLANALVVLLSSFPQHAPPDDRLVDTVLEFALASTPLKQGSAPFGAAALVAVVAPFMVSRGPAAADDIAVACARAMKVTPTTTERAMWALALVRASVTARRSTTFQLRKYGNSEVGARFPSDRPNATSARTDPVSESDATLWVSNEIFEEALMQISNLTSLSDGNVDASISVACLLKMWVTALPKSLPVIIPRVFARLSQTFSAVPAMSAVVDAVWLGVLKHLRPSQSPIVFDSLVPLLSDAPALLAPTLSVCASLLAKFGRQPIRESGLSTDYNTTTSILLKRVHDALESVVPSVRFSAVRLILALLQALPRTCTQLLTAVLQNLRIADLTMASKPMIAIDTNSFEPELSALLGNGAALSVLLERVGNGTYSVPNPLIQQCIVDVLSLLRPHKAASDNDALGPIAACIRRRVAWGIIAGMAKGKRSEIFQGDSMATLLYHWREELRYAGHTNRSSKGLSAPFTNSSSIANGEDTDFHLSAALDEALARCSARAAALCALSNALQFISSDDLTQLAQGLVGACSSRIISLLSNINSCATPGSSSGTGSFMGFGTEHIISNDSTGTKKNGIVLLVKALTAESTLLVQCLGHVPPDGDAGELCYYLVLALVEEAQRALGEVDASHTVNSSLTHGSSSSDRSSSFESVLLNRRCSMNSLMSHIPPINPRRSGGWDNEKAKPSEENESKNDHTADLSWVFSREGVSEPIAENVLIHCARGLAAVVSQNLSSHGSLIESLPGAKLSPSFSAAISLELIKRLSRSDLQEINRALAVLQVLVKRSLGLTGGCHKSVLSQLKHGRLYTPSRHGDSHNIQSEHLPGSALQSISSSDGWLGWARSFSDEGYLSRMPFHNFHTRALGTMYATRLLASEAYRELSITGGATLWIGLMKKVIEIVKQHIGGTSTSQYITVSNAIATLGTLLEVVPEHQTGMGKQGQNSNLGERASEADILDETAEEAINVIAGAIESQKCYIQATSALALSRRSYRVAASSERLIGALLRAWAHEKGEFGSLGHFGRCGDEADVWLSCFSRIWYDMGVRSTDGKSRFFLQDSNSYGGVSAAFATGAAAVLAACRQYWWPLSESSFHSVKELSTELLQWEGKASHNSRAAGLYGMISIWASKIDAAQADRMSKVSSPTSEGKDVGRDAVVPVEIFSLKDASRAQSFVGPFLDEVLYASFAPAEDEDPSFELRAAAASAVLEMIRGVGAEITITNLPRLPETLFAAVEDGIPGALRVIDILVKRDAERRPRYWFGLCRAVSLGGDRLNYGRGDACWDVSYRTKAVSVRIAVDAIDCSMSSCDCARDDSSLARGVQLKHSCAYGFLRKVFDFVKQISSAASFDFECCGHGCRLLQRIATRIGSAASSWSGNDSTPSEYFELWDPCVAMMHSLLADRVPQGVVNSAATAISELLVSSLRLGSVKSSRQLVSSSETVYTYLQALMEADLRQRFLYGDQGEEVGMQAIFALIDKYGTIFSALKIAPRQFDQPAKKIDLSERTAKALFFAISGDFVSTLSGDGLMKMAREGGSLTSGHLSPSELQHAFSCHISSIVLGAISCTESTEKVIVHDSDLVWENETSPGVRMAVNTSDYEKIPISTLVWLVKHEHSDAFSKFRRLSFCNQCQEALEYIFCMTVDGRTSLLREEALLSFAQWNKTELLKFSERFSRSRGVDETCTSFILDLTLSVLLVSLQDEFGTFQENETLSLKRGFCALSNFVDNVDVYDTDSEREFVALKVLDVLLQMACNDSQVTSSVLVRREVQKPLFDCAKTCLTVAVGNAASRSEIENKLMSLFSYGNMSKSPWHVKLGVLLGSALGDIEDGSELFLMRMLSSTGSPFEYEGAVESPLGLSLDCHGVEDCIVDFITTRSDSNFPEVCTLLHDFGRLAASGENYDVPVALRCAVSAILVEGERKAAINKMGMVLYSVFVSRLIHSLPNPPYGVYDMSSSTSSSAKYFMEVVGEDLEDPENFIASLQEKERQAAHQFLATLRYNSTTLTT